MRLAEALGFYLSGALAIFPSMCYNYEYLKARDQKRAERTTKSTESAEKSPSENASRIAAQFYLANAFEGRRLPVITRPDAPEEYLHWGLIPHYFTPADWDNPKKRFMLANKRADDYKPFWKPYFARKRCLAPATAYYEWRAYNNKKYPYRIFLRDQEPFYFAGIWNEWINKETGEIVKSFSILTTAAEGLAAQIHNTKKRAPVIVRAERAEEFLGRPADDLQGLAQAFFQNTGVQLAAHTVSKRITSRTLQRDAPETARPFDYPELPPLV